MMKCLLFFIVFASAVSFLTELNHLDSNIHLDYIREIQKTHSIPVNHPHIYVTPDSRIPFPYPVGYHLTMALLPHSVMLYKFTQVIFAAVSIVLTLKLSETLGFGKNMFVVMPLVLSFSFARIILTPHPDLFALMLILLSTYFAAKYLTGGNWIHLLAGIGFGFYAGTVRESAILTLPFIWLMLWYRYPEKRRGLVSITIPTVISLGIWYYWLNCVIRGVSIIYPVGGTTDPQAHQWYLSHVSFWNILAHGYVLQILGTLGAVFSVFLILFLLARPRSKLMASIFGCQIILIFLLMPSTAGLDRYVLFTLPFLAIAYGNFFEKRNLKNLMIIMIVGMLLIYPFQGLRLNLKVSDDFENVIQYLDENDFVLSYHQGKIAYTVGCKAGWTSLFWSGDFYDTFENVERLENFISEYGVTHVLIVKHMILSPDSSMIGDDAVGYPRLWVEKIQEMGTKIVETEHYILYQV